MSVQKELAMKWATLIAHIFYQYYKLIAKPNYSPTGHTSFSKQDKKNIEGFHTLVWDFYVMGVIVERVSFPEVGVVASIRPGSRQGSLNIIFHTNLSLKLYELLIDRQTNNLDWLPGHDLDEDIAQDYPLLLRKTAIKHYPDNSQIILEIPPLAELEEEKRRLVN